MNIDSLIYHNGLLALLIGSFVLFICCVMCIGACTDRGLCCHEHIDMDRLRAHRRNIHALELFHHTCVQVPQIFRHIVEVNPQSNSTHSILEETPPILPNSIKPPNGVHLTHITEEIGSHFLSTLTYSKYNPKHPPKNSKFLVLCNLFFFLAL